MGKFRKIRTKLLSFINVKIWFPGSILSICFINFLCICVHIRYESFGIEDGQISRFVSGLYLEHFLNNFLQTLVMNSYQEGVVWRTISLR